jgi:hypothetical protein
MPGGSVFTLLLLSVAPLGGRPHIRLLVRRVPTAPVNQGVYLPLRRVELRRV